jgi:hypothetical protein
MLQIGEKVELSLTGEINTISKSFVDGKLTYTIAYKQPDGSFAWISGVTEDMIVKKEYIIPIPKSLGNPFGYRKLGE